MAPVIIPQCPCPSFWADISNTLIGAFAGALFAFLVSIYIQNRQRKRERLAACNLAMMILNQQYGDFKIAKAAITTSQREAINIDQNVPLWIQLQKTRFYFSVKQTLNLESIAFILEGNADVVEKLLLVDVKYHDLIHLSIFNDSAYKRDEILSEHGGVDGIPWPVLEQRLGVSLIGNLSSLTQGIYLRIENDEIAYRSAGNRLYQLMINWFKESDIVPFKPFGADMKKIDEVTGDKQNQNG